MNRINLIPLPYRQRQVQRRRLRLGLALSLALALLLAMAAGLTLDHFHALESARQAAQQRAGQGVLVESAQVTALEADIAQLQARHGVLEALRAHRHVALTVFDELSMIVPLGLALTSVHQEGHTLRLKGVAWTVEPVAELMNRLEHGSSTLRDPQWIEMRSAMAGAGRVTFSVSAQVRQGDLGQAGLREPDGAEPGGHERHAASVGTRAQREGRMP